MREGLVGLLLVLGLCGSAAWAEDPPAEAAPEDASGDVPEDAAPAEAKSDESEVAEDPLLPAYEVIQGNAESASDGDLRVSVTQSIPRLPRGYMPLEVSLHNMGATPRAVRVSVESSTEEQYRATVAVRQVELGPHQRLSAWLPIPLSVRAGTVRVDSPGVKLHAFSFYASSVSGQPLLVLGTEKVFQEGTRLPREAQGARLSVYFMSPEDAPRELSAYVGYPEVVVAGEVTALPADVWSALEAYAATGGTLTLLRPPRDVAARLPLLTGTNPGGVQSHGFGQVRLCASPKACAGELLADATARGESTASPPGAVHPAPPPAKWQTAALGGDFAPLLPGVQAPAGRLLGFITLFVLAVGPGGLLLARRKGPLVLLIAVPSVALVTCLAIVLWSVLMEGFDLHAARYSVTWLDRPRDRAVTVGLGGYFANLTPEPFSVPVLSALLSSDTAWDSRPIEADWTQGLSVTGGFLLARTYREWGEVTVMPSRARLGVRHEGTELTVLNALGAPLVDGYVRSGETWWRVPALAEGAEGRATRLPAEDAQQALPALGFSREVERRLAPALERVLHEPLPEGGFFVRLDGPGGTFSRALPVKLHEGVHLVRGQVDGR